jgi:putative heme-binding domain-containing protein
VKQLLRAILILVSVTATCTVVNAQSSPLQKSLLAENASSLASEARERGDSVRGAILYAQKKLNCVGCHAQGSTDLLGPDLTQTGGEVDDSFFVESILLPSKLIKKGFESVQLLTADGRVLTGRLVKEDATRVILRDTSDASRLIEVSRDEVEQIQPSTKSAMPEGLVDELRDRQQFLDLIKYLMDIAETGPVVKLAATNLGGGVVDDRIQGLALIDHYGCANCHAIDTATMVPKKQAPDLSLSTARIDPRYLQRFVADPLHVKPGTSMPDLLGTLEPDKRNSVAEAITNYLLTLTDIPFQRQTIDHASASRGQDLFHSVGCVSCHSPRKDSGEEWMADDSIALGSVEEKYSLEGLVSFLSDPHASRPSGRMPNMSLTHWEAIDLANYLLQDRDGGSEGYRAGAANSENPSLADAGKRYFEQFQCAECHRQDGRNADSPALAIGNVNADRGCLSGNAGSWPQYELTVSQIDTIRAAIKQTQDPLTDEQQIRLSMQTLRCFQCHSRGNVGGVTGERDDFFLTADPNLGPQGRIPPTLTGIGAKLKPDWMREVLVSGRVLRPYVKTRMPRYGAVNVAHMVDLFQRADKLPEVKKGGGDDLKEIKKAGVELAGSGGLNCVACHTFQQQSAQTMNGVDLTEMAERLHEDWFYRYLQSPQTFNPNTVMPSFWPGGRAIRGEILAGNTTDQIEALWVYLSDGRQARVPRGLIREPIELLASDEAVMLRRNYQGIGKRGIGVGLPGGVNFAYDAQQMRLAMIWKGKFADPSAAWRGQGSGTVRPLGNDLQRFATGSELGRSVRTPEIPPTGVNGLHSTGHHFTGYSLDEFQRPTFTYRYGDIEVEDRIVDVIDPHGDADQDPAGRDSILQRTLRFESPQNQQDLVFRIGSDQEIEAEDAHVFRFGRSLQIRVASPHEARIVDSEDEKHLIIPLDLHRGQTILVLDYVW